MPVLKRYNAGTATWEVVSAPTSGPIFADWVPILTASVTNPTLGTGSTVDGRYGQNGKEIQGFASITFGSSGVAAGSGEYRVVLPVAPRVESMNRVVGSGLLYDSSAAQSRNVTVFIPAGANYVRFLSEAVSTVVSNASPWTWAANDEIAFSFSYEAS